MNASDSAAAGSGRRSSVSQAQLSKPQVSTKAARAAGSASVDNQDRQCRQVDRHQCRKLTGVGAIRDHGGKSVLQEKNGGRHDSGTGRVSAETCVSAPPRGSVIIL